MLQQATKVRLLGVMTMVNIRMKIYCQGKRNDIHNYLGMIFHQYAHRDQDWYCQTSFFCNSIQILAKCFSSCFYWSYCTCQTNIPFDYCWYVTIYSITAFLK